MQLKSIPYITMLLVTSTIIVSLTANYFISGTFFGKNSIRDLESYGGYRLDNIINFELWRLFASQLIHVKQAHMFYNALSLLVLGCLLERRIGSFNFITIWLIAGSAGTFTATFSVSPPWNLATGGSQAVLALAGVLLAFYLTGRLKSKLVLYTLTLVIFPAFVLDLIYAENHLPKLGHVLSFSLGLLIAVGFSLNPKVSIFS